MRARHYFDKVRNRSLQAHTAFPATVEAPAPPTDASDPPTAPGASTVRMLFPPGHYYSPIPDLGEVADRDATIFNRSRPIRGIDLNPRAQLELVKALARYQVDMPFEAQAKDGYRYQFDNEFFAYGDGLILYSMIAHFRPSRIIEVGSGFSSALMLDTRDFLGLDLELTFLEPYPDRLLALLQPRDRASAHILSCRLQDADLDLFYRLEAGDFLFIDSSHVSKVDSDVNLLLFDVLPRLAPGVIVHFHDIFYPFEYPREWIYQGRAWNELYILRAFLMNNPDFNILLFNSYLGECHRDEVAQSLPWWDRNPGGSLWLRHSPSRG